MSPAYAALAAARGVGDHARFISPPPVAVLLIPLAWLSFRNALAVWDILMTLCAWGVALQASAAYGKLIGRPAWGQGLLLLMIGLCPPFHDALNSGNISLLMALLISLAMRGIIARRERCTALSIQIADFSPPWRRGADPDDSAPHRISPLPGILRIVRRSSPAVDFPPDGQQHHLVGCV
jgi:hypothetical protein